ncbi:hypothetical protein [Polyangium sp. 6x1]|uniref:hypothetical protein n=1 Tax=Polyangium sp. 6x1 TaxID=3042689 RepID=UPI002482D1F2|nr:hypothetical protein [Polyangium sp. 6x1]MDI1444541.1 hypothetical protein [Polyangium sp. 6x1]
MQRVCDGGACSAETLPAATPTESQLQGDCRRTVCDGAGNVVFQEDVTDAYDDGKECTLELCDQGVSQNEPTAPGTPCAGGYCNASGECVACVDPSQCQAPKTCVIGACVPLTCANGQKDIGETDIDCGGACSPCIPGKACQLGVDCASKVCTGAQCAMASCSDGVKNGKETGVDCGGACAMACGVGEGCAVPSHCVSGVCIGGICKAPTCEDAVKNGMEQGIDCGGGCPLPCGP